MKQFILFGKLSTLGLWTVLIVNLFYPLAGETYSQYLIWGFLALTITHLFEALVFMNKNKASTEPVFVDALQVFAFGFFHPLSLKDKV